MEPRAGATGRSGSSPAATAAEARMLGGTDDNSALLSLQDSVCNPLVRAAALVDVMQRCAREPGGTSAAEVADAMVCVSAEISHAIDTLHTAISRTAILAHDYEPSVLSLELRELLASSARAPGVRVTYAAGTAPDEVVEIDPLPLRTAIDALRRHADAPAPGAPRAPAAPCSLRLQLGLSAGALRVRVRASGGAHASSTAADGAAWRRPGAAHRPNALVDACAHALGGRAAWGDGSVGHSALAAAAAPAADADADAADADAADADADARCALVELTLPVRVRTLTAERIDAFCLPACASVVIVDDSRLTRCVVRTRVLAQLCAPGVQPTVIPPLELADADPEAARALHGYARTLAALVRAGPVVLFSDYDLGVGVPTGAQVIQHVRATVPEAEANLVACVVSANGSSPDRRRYATMGADVFVSKAKDGLRHARPAIARACARRFGARACMSSSTALAPVAAGPPAEAAEAAKAADETPRRAAGSAGRTRKRSLNSLDLTRASHSLLASLGLGTGLADGGGGGGGGGPKRGPGGGGGGLDPLAGHAVPCVPSSAELLLRPPAGPGAARCASASELRPPTGARGPWPCADVDEGSR